MFNIWDVEKLFHKAIDKVSTDWKKCVLHIHMLQEDDFIKLGFQLKLGFQDSTIEYFIANFAESSCFELDSEDECIELSGVKIF